MATRIPELSRRRAETLELLIRTSARYSTPAAGNIKGAYSHDADKSDDEHPSDGYRVAIARAVKKPNTKQRNATAVLVEKPSAPATEPPVEHPPEAAEPDRPPIFRRLGFRTRFERDDLVLFEISGQFDFRVQAEEAAGFIQTGDPRNSGPPGLADAVTTPPTANQSRRAGRPRLPTDHRLRHRDAAADRGARARLRSAEPRRLGQHRRVRSRATRQHHRQPPGLRSTCSTQASTPPLTRRATRPLRTR